MDIDAKNIDGVEHIVSAAKVTRIEGLNDEEGD